ncbi:hypothetical protein SpCBS45565_g02857 [Spizellomyces sp. 'palustris']|nr:hypothetical protein SpCBS45565_g02857 [Spizellomyces sp. 'palustris']
MYLIPSQTIHLRQQLDNCPVDHDAVKLALGSFITAGLILSYVPQFIKIVQRKTSEGLSLWFLLLGAIGMASTVGNMALLQYPYVLCCKRPMWTPLMCFENTLGLTQVGIQTVCFMTCVVLYFAYYPAAKKHIPNTVPPAYAPQWRRSLYIGCIIIMWIVILTVGVIAILAFDADALGYSRTAEWVAGVLGLIAMQTSLMQFFPQIVHTWFAKAVGALSIPTMLMQCPGSFIFVYSLAVQPGANWTSWLPYLVSGVLQGVLLTMCIVFSMRNKEELEDGVQAPLLGPADEGVDVQVEDQITADGNAPDYGTIASKAER